MDAHSVVLADDVAPVPKGRKRRRRRRSVGATPGSAGSIVTSVSSRWRYVMDMGHMPMHRALAWYARIEASLLADPARVA